jgi:hypothetical protein
MATATVSGGGASPSQLLFGTPGAMNAKQLSAPATGANGRQSALASGSAAAAAPATATSAATAPASATSAAAAASAAKPKKSAFGALVAQAPEAAADDNLYKVPVTFRITPANALKPSKYTIPVVEQMPQGHFEPGTKFLLKSMTLSADTNGIADSAVVVHGLEGKRVMSLPGGQVGAPYHVEVQGLGTRRIAPVTISGYDKTVINADHFTRYGSVKSAEELESRGIQQIDATREWYVKTSSPIGRALQRNNIIPEKDRVAGASPYRYYDPATQTKKLKNEKEFDPVRGKDMPVHVIILPEDTAHIKTMASQISKKVLESEAFANAAEKPVLELSVVNPTAATGSTLSTANLQPITVRGTAEVYAFKIKQ